MVGRMAAEGQGRGRPGLARVCIDALFKVQNGGVGLTHDGIIFNKFSGSQMSKTLGLYVKSL